MEEKTKETLRGINAEADKVADNLLDHLRASPYSAIVMLLAMMAAFFLGFWAGR